MKKALSIILAICILMSVISAAVVSINAADTDTSDVGDTDLSKYTDIRLGETVTIERTKDSGQYFYYKLTPAKSIIVRFLLDYSYTVNLNVKTAEGSSCSAIRSATEDDKKAYYYDFHAGTTYLIIFDTRLSSNADSAILTALIEAYSEGLDVSLNNDAETDVYNDFYYKFTPDHDMIASVLRDYDDGLSFKIVNNGKTPLQIQSFSTSRSGGYRSVTFCSFTAGTEYFFCPYQSKGGETAKRIRLRIEENGSFEANTTKSISFDKDNYFVKAFKFAPQKDMFIKISPSNLNNPDSSSAFRLYLTDYTNNKTESVISDSVHDFATAKVYAGKEYLFSCCFTDYKGVSGDVTIEEYFSDDISINEEVNMESGNSIEYYRFVPDRDTVILITGKNNHNIEFMDQDLKTVSRFLGSSSGPAYKIQKDKVYFVSAERAKNPYQFSLSEIVPAKVSLNEEISSSGDEYGYSFFSFTPDSDMFVNIYYSVKMNSDLTVYDDNLKEVSKLSRTDYSYDLNNLTTSNIGKEYYYILKKGVEYLFYQRCSNPTETPVFCINKTKITNIELDKYYSLYTHRSDEYLLFKYTAPSDMLLQKDVFRESDDTRAITFDMYNSSFEKVGSGFDQFPYVLRAGCSYYFIGKVTFDLYCDDLDCGVTLSSPKIKTLKPGESYTAEYGDCYAFSADRECVVDITANKNKGAALYDSDFNNIRDISNSSSSKNYLYINKGETYYLRCGLQSSEEDIVVTTKVISYVEPLQLNVDKEITFSEEDEIKVFSYVPEYDFVGELSRDDSDYKLSPRVSYSENNPTFNFNTFSTLMQYDMKAGTKSFFAVKLYSSSYSEGTGSFTIRLRDYDKIIIDQTVLFRVNDTDYFEHTLDFIPDDDMMVHCIASSNYVNTTSVGFRAVDSEGNLLAENEDDCSAERVFSVKQGQKYKITYYIESDGDYCNGQLALLRVDDIKIGDKVTKKGLCRFIPKTDVCPAFMLNYSDGTRGYKTISILDADLNYVNSANSFGGNYVELTANDTYYFSISNYDLDYDSVDEITICDAEELKIGETKHLVLPSGYEWVYQITCEKETTIKISAEGTGNCLAVLRDGPGNVYKNSIGNEESVFSLGHTVPAGTKMLLYISAHEDTDVQITMQEQGDFEISDGKLVKYYGNDKEPVIPRVIEICDSAFLYSDSIERIDIPDSVTSLGKYAFGRCYSLEEVTIPGSVKTIGQEAFTFDMDLRKVTFGEGITTIEQGAFLECMSLSSIELPESLKTIGGTAFLGCTGVKVVTIPKNVTSIGEMAFGYYDDLDGIQKIDNFTIRGYKGSAAEQYAKENGFTFVDLGSGEITKVAGDINGDNRVNSDDIDLLQQFVNKCDVKIFEDNADVNADGKINMKDIVLIRQYLNGWNVQLL